ncbi:MAG: hypothetical protein NW216_11400 [Hyphomicrobium sp.]|nr:hypothetical protein [Hyphomicrobium sp.]
MTCRAPFAELLAAMSDMREPYRHTALSLADAISRLPRATPLKPDAISPHSASFLSLYEKPDADFNAAYFEDAWARLGESTGDASALSEFRRSIAPKLHPDVVPEAFQTKAEALMTALNVAIDRARLAGR